MRDKAQSSNAQEDKLKCVFVSYMWENVPEGCTDLAGIVIHCITCLYILSSFNLLRTEPQIGIAK